MARIYWVVDHIDHDGLNNRRSNLRVCTPQQNVWNACGQGARSGFKGVWYRQGKGYEAAAKIDGQKHSFGWFDEPIEAAKARDGAVYELCGEYAYLNFPEDFTSGKRDK